MTFEQATARRDELETTVNATAAVLRALRDQDCAPLGLTSDAVKATPEWKAAHAAYNRAFANLQKFNIWYVKTFKAELRAARRARGK